LTASLEEGQNPSDIFETKTRTIGKNVEEWLKSFDSEATKNNYLRWFEKFLRFHNTTAEELVKGVQEASDKHQWAKEHGTKLVQFQMFLRQQGFATNTARMATIGARSFYASQRMKVLVKRGAIPQIKPVLGEHEFAPEELRKMFYYGDVKGKAILVTGIALGWGKI
jgi:hypothetical protein